MRDQSGNWTIGFAFALALLCAPACVMVGYDPSPAASAVVSAPHAGSGANGSSGDAQDGGSDQSGSRAGSAGSNAGGTGAGTGSPNEQDAGPSLEPMGCEGRPDGATCEDGFACTTGEACLADACVGGVPVVCAPSINECVKDSCDEASGVCSNDPLPEGTPCGLFQTRVCRNNLCVQQQTDCDGTNPDFCEVACTGPTVCGLLCGDAHSCQADCDDSVQCDVDCGGSAVCWSVCAEGSECTIDCAGREGCHSLCQAGATCQIDCTDTTDCTDIDCDPGSICTLICNGSTACQFDECAIGQQTCPDNVVACGACP